MAVNHIQSYPRGTVLFSAGDKAAALHFILEGRVLVTKGEEQMLLGAGGILGDAAFFQEGSHNYTALCVGDVKALTITKENADKLVAKQPLIALSIMRELALKAQTDELLFFQGKVEEDRSQAPSASGVLPEGHPAFLGAVPAEYGELLFPVEADCPICQGRFTGMRVRTSRLQLAEQKPDFRYVYRNFEPNYFYIWVCPHCLFAYPERQFKKVPISCIRRGQAAYQASPPTETFEFAVPRTVQQVITSYYLALKTADTVEAPLDLRANLWLRLLWIYEDLEAEELARTAAQKARHYFSQSMSQTARSPAGDQQLLLILAELDLRLGNAGEAFRNFHAAATLPGGDPRFKRMASDRILDLRTGE